MKKIIIGTAIILTGVLTAVIARQMIRAELDKKSDLFTVNARIIHSQDGLVTAQAEDGNIWTYKGQGYIWGENVKLKIDKCNSHNVKNFRIVDVISE